MIEFTLRELNAIKVSAFSFSFGRNKLNNVFNRIGIILKEGEIIRFYSEDSGLTREMITRGVPMPASDSIREVIYAEKAVA